MRSVSDLKPDVRFSVIRSVRAYYGRSNVRVRSEHSCSCASSVCSVLEPAGANNDDFNDRLEQKIQGGPKK